MKTVYADPDMDTGCEHEWEYRDMNVFTALKEYWCGKCYSRAERVWDRIEEAMVYRVVWNYMLPRRKQ